MINFPDNKIGDFKNQFSGEIDLGGAEYETALAKIIFPKTCNSLDDDDCIIDIVRPIGMRGTKFGAHGRMKIEERQFASVNDLIDHINAEANKYSSYLNFSLGKDGLVQIEGLKCI